VHTRTEPASSRSTSWRNARGSASGSISSCVLASLAHAPLQVRGRRGTVRGRASREPVRA
jgi:hypothetical protein